MAGKCLTMSVKKGKLIVKTSKSKKCKKQVETAQDILDSVKTKKIIYK